MCLKSVHIPTETATTGRALVVAVICFVASVTTISDSVSEVLEPLMMTMLATVHWGDTQLERWEMMISALALPA